MQPSRFSSCAVVAMANKFIQFTWERAMTNVKSSGCYKIGPLTVYRPDTFLRHGWSSQMKHFCVLPGCEDRHKQSSTTQAQIHLL